MFKYQNVSKVDQTITASGNINPRIVKAGETVVADVAIENPNFKYVGEADAPNSIQGTVNQPQAGAVTNAELVNENKEENK
jgi:hypothetical protein